NDTVESSRGQPSGTLCVATITGTPIGWLPPQPPATSNVRRPYTITPRLAASGSPALASDVCEVGCGLLYQANTRCTPSEGSATKPSSDIDISAATVAIGSSFWSQ